MSILCRSALAAFSVAAALCSATPAVARATQDLSANWRFAKSAGDNGQQTPVFDDGSWQRLDLPHSWNKVGGPMDKPYESDTYSGPAWYRLHFLAAKPATGGARTYLQFDGVGTVADVWLNGRYLGRHEGAMGRFRLDATRVVKPGKDNVLAVKADNSRPQPGSATEHVVPLAGDFFMHGGIYRTVALVTTAPVHIDMMDFGGPGVYARATAVDERSADVEVRTRVTNDSDRPQTLDLAVRILDAAGAPVASQTQKLRLAPHKTDEAVTHLAVAKPHLWNGEADPYLYRVAATLTGGRGKAVDEVSQPLGLRTLKFDADKGFFLNGKHVALRGVALHQDLAGKGWAMSCADQKRDFDIVQEIGANSVRLAHYQHDQCSYDETDRRGLVVWAEVPVVSEVSFDGSPPSPALIANAKQQFTELVRQNYNHPSIVTWSIGNEIDLLPSINNTPSKAGPLVRELAETSRQEDPSRPSTFADCCENPTLTNHDMLTGYTDLAGYNRYFGWYYGAFNDFGPFLDKMHAAHPKLPIAVPEYGAGAALSQHSDDAWGGAINPHGRPQPEEYQSLYHELAWPQIKARPYLWATYVWNLFDFAVKSREEGDTNDINTKGLVTGDRQTRKDAFYYYQANWTDKPVLHILGRRYTDRPYPVIDVKAYSNATSAALSVNGKPAANVACDAGVCLWKNVTLDKGRNDVRVTATIAGTSVSDAVQWSYSGDPRTVRIKAGDLMGYTTAGGVRYGSDLYFSGGTGRGISPPDTKSEQRAAVAGPDSGLYDSYREGDFAYAIPLPDGRYKVTLHFTEPSANAAAERLFAVRAGGKTVVKNIDVFGEAGGKLKPLTRRFTVTVRGGTLNLQFHASKGLAVLSACEVEPE